MTIIVGAQDDKLILGRSGPIWIAQMAGPEVMS